MLHVYASAVTHSTFTRNEETKETTVRALAEVGQTRTWGLMIDVIDSNWAISSKRLQVWPTS